MKKSKRFLLFFIVLFISLILQGIPFQAMASTKNEIFTDVNEKDWFYESVVYLSKKDIINGYTDNSFRPSNKVRADEFIKMILKVLKEDLENDKDYWAKNYINRAKSLGILKDFDKNDYTFYINRGETSLLLTNTLNLLGEKPNNKNQILPFDLGSYTPNLYLESIKTAFYTGLIEGFEDYTFRYNETLTRAQSACLIERLDSKDKRIEKINYDLSFIDPKKEPDVVFKNVKKEELPPIVLTALAEIEDSVGYIIVEKKVFETKDTYEIFYQKSRQYFNPIYCMFSLRFFDGPTAYPEKQWGYDTMFLKLEMKSLDWEDGIPISFYKAKVKNTLCAVLSDHQPQEIVEYIMDRYDYLRALPTREAYNLLEDNQNQTLRYVFFTMQNVVGNFTFSLK